MNVSTHFGLNSVGTSRGDGHKLSTTSECVANFLAVCSLAVRESFKLLCSFPSVTNRHTLNGQMQQSGQRHDIDNE